MTLLLAAPFTGSLAYGNLNMTKKFQTLGPQCGSNTDTKHIWLLLPSFIRLHSSLPWPFASLTSQALAFPLLGTLSIAFLRFISHSSSN